MRGKPSSNTHATCTMLTCHQFVHTATHSWSLPDVPAPSSNIPATTSPKGEQIPCPSDGRLPSGFSTPFPVQAAATDTSSPSKAACAHAPGGPRSSSPKLLVTSRSSGNDQANCFEEDFVPAAQLATQKLRINCKPSKTLGKPKINTAKEEHFPLESHGQVKSVSSGLVPRRQLRFIYFATHINVSLWLCCSLDAPFQPGRKKPHYSDTTPLVEQENGARARAVLKRRQQPQPHTEPLPRAWDHPSLHTGEDAASVKPE